MSTTRLPVLFAADLVVLPGMVVPVELDESTRAAVDAASAADDRLLIAPRLADRYAAYGVVATVEQVGRLNGGTPVAVLKGITRARIGSGVTGPGAALWVEAEELGEAGTTDRTAGLVDRYRHLVVSILQRREAWQVVDTVNRVSDPSALADMAGYAPYLSDERKLEILETPGVDERLEKLISWTEEHVAETEVADKIGDDVRERMEKSQREFLLRQQLAAIRKELGDDEAAGVDGLPVPRRVGRAARRRAGGRPARGRQARARRGPEPRVRLDPHLARHRARAPVEPPHHRQHRRRGRARGPRRGPPRPGRRQGPDRRVPRGPRASGRAGARDRRRPRIRRRRRSWPARPGLARPRSAKASHGPSAGRSYVSPSAASATRPRSEATDAPTSVRFPGRIVRAIKESGSMNPVVLLDEMDKVGSDYRGDPAAALLEVLDPPRTTPSATTTSSSTWTCPTSLFIATANVVDTIPSAAARPHGAGHPRRLHRGRQGRDRP